MAHDYYISFCDADETWASWLAWELEQAGHSVYFEGWGGRLYGDRVLGLQRALSGAARIVLVLSADYLANPQAQRELSAAQMRPEDVLPVKVRAIVDGALLPQMTPLDLVECSEEEARRRLRLALRKGPAAPTVAPRFPNAPRSLPQKPAFPGEASQAPPATLTVVLPAEPTPAAPVVLQQGLLIRNTWRIERRLGRGGMGEVWLARNERLKAKRVAVKVLLGSSARNPQLAKRFFQEAEAVAKLGLPGLVAIEDFGLLADGAPFLVMEFLEGESLAARLLRGGNGLGSAGLGLLVQLADVLAVVHVREVVHRDLKPENLMVVPDPGMPSGERLKVLDFGIAKVARGEGSSVGTEQGLPMGTPAYMAPEQFKDAATVTSAADVYALGVLLYEVVTGRRPFHALDFPGWVHKHCLEPAPKLPVPAAWSALTPLCAKMLAKDPAARPSAAGVAIALRDLLSANPPAMDPRRPLLLGALGGAATVLLVLVVVLSASQRGSVDGRAAARLPDLGLKINLLPGDPPNPAKAAPPPDLARPQFRLLPE